MLTDVKKNMNILQREMEDTKKKWIELLEMKYVTSEMKILLEGITQIDLKNLVIIEIFPGHPI